LYGISFIDSTSLTVCHNPCIHQHRVFTGLAARGKTSVGWFDAQDHQRSAQKHLQQMQVWS